MYGSKNYGFCCGRGPYKKYKCAHDACYTSKDRTVDLSTFDAIVFHGRNLNKNDVPTKFPDMASIWECHLNFASLFNIWGYLCDFVLFSILNLLLLATLEAVIWYVHFNSNHRIYEDKLSSFLINYKKSYTLSFSSHNILSMYF